MKTRCYLAVAVSILSFGLWADSASAITFQDFDVVEGGTFYWLHQFGAGTGPEITSDIIPSSLILDAGPSPSGNYVRLAHAGVDGELNQIAFANSDPGVATMIVMDHDFRIGGGTRGDGFSLVLVNDALQGASGPVTGVDEEGNLAGALGFEFDTTADGTEHSNNHIGIHFNAAEVAELDIPLTTLDLADNNWHHAHIVADLATGLVSWSIDDVLYFDDVSVPGLAPYDPRVAYTSKTGSNDNHDLDNIQAVFTIAAEVPEPSTLALFGLGLAGLLATFYSRKK